MNPLITVTAPAAWTDYLLRGDESGLDQTELLRADAFRASLKGELVAAGPEYFSPDELVRDYAFRAED